MTPLVRTMPPPRVATNGNSRRAFFAQALELTGCNSLLDRVPAWQGVLILNYHRIGNCESSSFDHQLWSATAESFDLQMSLLRAHFDVIGLQDLSDVMHRQRGRYVLLTFDDGYADNYFEAFPILKRHHLSATFFLSTGFLDQPQATWWDEVAWMVHHAAIGTLPRSHYCGEPVELADREVAVRQLLDLYKQLPGDETAGYLDWLGQALGSGRCPPELAHREWMTWDQVREMDAAGMTFGGHTVSHPILANVSPEQQDFEVGHCKARIEAELGHPIDSFSYPVGGPSSYNQHTRDALARHGYRWAFTYCGSYVPFGELDHYALRRSAVELDIDRALFRAITTLPQVFA